MARAAELSWLLAPVILWGCGCQSIQRQPEYHQPPISNESAGPPGGFPAVYTLPLLPPAGSSASEYREILADADLLHVDCSEGVAGEEEASCSAYLLLHSEEEWGHFRSMSVLLGAANATNEPPQHLLLEYDPVATEALVREPLRRQQQSEEVSRKLEEETAESGPGPERSRFFNSSDLFALGYSRIQGLPCYLDYQGTMDWLKDLVETNNNFYNRRRRSVDPQIDETAVNATNTSTDTVRDGADGDSGFRFSMELLDIGDSYEKTRDNTTGHDIHAFVMTSENSPVPLSRRAPVLIVTGVHPREYAPLALVREWIESLVAAGTASTASATAKDETGSVAAEESTNSDDSHTHASFASLADLQATLDATVIYWIPYANPDGRILAEQSQPMRRKNLNRESNGALSCRNDEYGVDLNRNFPFRWGMDEGSSNRVCSQTYRGTGPASEPETKAIVDFAASIFPAKQQREQWWKTTDSRTEESTISTAFSDVETSDGGDFISAYLPPAETIQYNEDTTTGIFLDIHAYGNYYIYPWGFENSETANHKGLSAMAHKLRYFTGYRIRGPGYAYTSPASGATDDWAYAALGSAGMTWELGTNFQQDCATFENDILPKNFPALTYATKLAWRPYSLAKGPDITRLVPSSLTLEPGQPLSVTIEASDSAYSNAELEMASQKVDSVLIFVDQHPYTTDLEFPDWVMEGKELTENGRSEFTWEWKTLQMYWFLNFKPEAGTHMFYFIARDTDGYKGPVSALSIEVLEVETSAPTAILSEPAVTLTPSLLVAPTRAPGPAPTRAPLRFPTEPPTMAPVIETETTISPTEAESPFNDSETTACSFRSGQGCGVAIEDDPESSSESVDSLNEAERSGAPRLGFPSRILCFIAAWTVFMLER